jgi:thioredoxin 1
MSERAERADTTEPLVAVEAESEFEEILANEPAVLVDFYVDWCGPCQLMEETVESVSETVDAAVVKVDVDAFPGLAAHFNVSSIPTFIGFDRGEPSDRLIGMQDEESLCQLVG